MVYVDMQLGCNYFKSYFVNYAENVTFVRARVCMLLILLIRIGGAALRPNYLLNCLFVRVSTVDTSVAVHHDVYEVSETLFQDMGSVSDVLLVYKSRFRRVNTTE